MAHSVELYVYDLSGGMAATMSHSLKGIWHCTIKVYNREYYFDTSGVESCNPASSILGEPKTVVQLGTTRMPYAAFENYLNGLSTTRWTGASYDFFTHQSNHFAEEIAQFLCKASVPKHILDLPNQVRKANLFSVLPGLVSSLEDEQTKTEELV